MCRFRLFILLLQNVVVFCLLKGNISLRSVSRLTDLSMIGEDAYIEEIQQLVDARVELRRELKFKEADVLLQELRRRDVIVDDISYRGGQKNAGGSTWSFANKMSTDNEYAEQAHKTIMEMIEVIGDDEITRDFTALIERIKENSELSFRRDLELSGRAFSDAAFSLAVRGVQSEELYAELVRGQMKELERCAHRASFRLIDVLMIAEKFAVAGVIDGTFYSFAAQKIKNKISQTNEEVGPALHSSIERLESGEYNLLDDRPLLSLFRHGARQPKAGLQAPTRMSGALSVCDSEDINALFQDPSLPLVVDMGCGFGVSLLGLAQQGAAAYNYLGVDMSSMAINYAQGISKRWKLAAQCQFVVADALSAMNWVESYAGKVEIVLCQFPTPPKYSDEEHEGDGAQDNNNDTELVDLEDVGNSQLPDMETFIINPEVVRVVSRLLSEKGGGGAFIVQSQVEDVIVMIKELVESESSVLLVPSKPGLLSSRLPWATECVDEQGWVSAEELHERSASQAARPGSRLHKYLASRKQPKRACGECYLTENPLGRRGRTETEVFCSFEGNKPVHRLAFLCLNTANDEAA